MLSKRALIAAVVFIAVVLFSSVFESVEGERTPAALSSSKGELSPNDRISADNIHVLDNKVVIELDGAIWARIKDTKSMEPVLNKNSNSLEIRPDSADDIKIGDIISYKSENSIIIHRVISIGNDESGWFAVTKGDNNNAQDPEPVRFGQIEGIVVGILY